MGSLRLTTGDFSDANELQSVLKPCTCVDEEEENERNYMYLEGTQNDNNMSDSKYELGENVWFEIKPPRMFIRDFSPTITSRQIYVTRIVMEGTPSQPEDNGGDEHKINVSTTKKKSAVRFLSQPHMNLEL